MNLMQSYTPPAPTYTPYDPARANYYATLQQTSDPNLVLGAGSLPINPPRPVPTYTSGGGAGLIGTASFGGGGTGSTSTTGSTGLPGYNVTPSAHAGGSAYGSVPGPIAVPPSTFQQLQTTAPEFANLLPGASSFINTELMGSLSPATIAAIQDNAAAFGVTTGMPGSQFAGYHGLRNLGLNVENLQRQGAQDLGGYLSALGGMQTNPALAAEIADRNAAMAAAPDPAAAAARMEQLWQEHFQQMQGYGGAGTGNFAPTNILRPAPSYGAPSSANDPNSWDNLFSHWYSPAAVSYGGEGTAATAPASSSQWTVDPNTGQYVLAGAPVSYSSGANDYYAGPMTGDTSSGGYGSSEDYYNQLMDAALAE